MKEAGCIFCQIVAGAKPARLLFEDDRCVALEDIHPMAPVHALILPRRHVASVAECTAEDESLLGHLLLVAARTAKAKGLAGFRLVVNTNVEAGQTVFHLHVHVLGGRLMRWPPG
jgi:histidine triad (HIT) family protein